MKKTELIKSQIDRQNILNNEYAIKEIMKAFDFESISFEGKIRFLKETIATFFEVDPRTIDRYIEKYNDELTTNGYEILRGQRLKDFIEIYNNYDGNDIDVVTIPKKTSILGIFDFRSFIDLAMLFADNERARIVRQIILDISIDTINKKAGGSTKYINQRDEDFLLSWYTSEKCRKEFTNALNQFVSGGKSKYPIYTDKIYTIIFKEKSQEYRQILKLELKDKTRDTMYSEVLDLIAGFELGLAKEIEKHYRNKNNQRLSFSELDQIINTLENNPFFLPLIEKARKKMASRDYQFRDAYHPELSDYISTLPADDYERFLGEKSKELLERITENQDVLKRLKEEGEE